MLRDLVAERMDPVLFALSYDYVGDLAETCRWSGRNTSARCSVRTASRSRRSAMVVGRTERPRRPEVAAAPTLGKAMLRTRAARRARRRRAGRSSSWSPAACASAFRRGWPRQALADLRQGRHRDRGDLARPGAALSSSCSPGWRARPTSRRNGDAALFRPVMLAHSGRATAISRSSIRPIHRRVEMGRHPRAGGGARERRCRAGSIRAPATISPAAFPDLLDAHRNSSRRARRRACWSAQRALAVRSQRSPTCSSG